MAANSGGAADKCCGGQRPGGIFEGCVLRKNVYELFVSMLYHQICLLICRNLPRTYNTLSYRHSFPEQFFFLLASEFRSRRRGVLYGTVMISANFFDDVINLLERII
jgi:hypothetical protein